MQEDNKSRLKSMNTCYHSMQNVVFFSFLLKNMKINMYRIKILPLFCMGGIHFHSHRLRVFGNRVMKRIFGCERDEVTGEWRKLLSEALNNLSPLTKYYSGDQIEKNQMGWACSTYGGEKCL